MESKCIDITYCYIDDVAKNPNWGEIYDPSACITYPDPDAKSKRLYDDMLCVWDKLSNRPEFPSFHFESNGRCSIKETTQDLFHENFTRYSSDFIGVNRKQAHLAGISKSEIVAYLKLQRTIGGHMLFPVRSKLSINQAKGFNMLERFDFTLAEMREYFIHLSTGSDSYNARYSKQLGDSFELHRPWFERFCIEKDNGIANFKMFIDYWLLDMFVSQDKECKVISLVSSDLENGKVSYIETENDEPYFPGLQEYPKWVSIRGIKRVLSTVSQCERDAIREAFERYINNLNLLIQKRNQAIEAAL